MGDGTEQKNEAQKPILDTDTFLDLNFVPQWARRPPDAVHAGRYRDHDAHDTRESHRSHRHDHARRDRSDRTSRDRHAPRREHDSGGSPKGRNRKPVLDSQTDIPAGAPAQQPVHRTRPYPTHGRTQTAPMAEILHAQFLPERKAISELAKRVAATHKAYPLLDLAGFLLAREGLCYVRLELADSHHADETLFQCQLCRTVSLQRESLVAHIVQDHLEEFFETETETLEPPTGVFTCVAICGLSNQLLGPPNHHSYQDAIKQIHTQQFSQMSLDTYRSKIRMSHDPEDVERWKASCTTRTIYRRKSSDEEKVSLREAQRCMEQEVVECNIKPLRRVVLQEAEAHAIRDRQIRAALHRAWERELRFPIHTALALRAALRSRNLHVFKAGTGKGMHFVTAIHPTPLNPDAAIPAIRDTLKYLQKHPGCTRQEIMHDLLGDVSPEDLKVKELLQPISWLTERGHIIEFFNGRLAVPRYIRG